MSQKIKLTYPIQLEGDTVDAITIRRPQARDLKMMEKSKEGDIAKSIELIASLANIPPTAVDELDASDFQKVNEAVADFLGQT